MKRLFLAALACAPILWITPAVVRAQESIRIDPLTLVALREAQSISAQLSLFPGWDFSDAPVLLYRPGVQDVMLNVDEPPQGFVRYTGPSPLGEEPIWVRNDSTEFDLDGQNTAAVIDGHRALVVADPASSMRNQLRSFAGMTPEQQTDWLEGWSFLGSPYDLVTTMLHEGFHVYQYEQGDKFADETLIAEYPLYDAENNALHELEGLILLAAARGETGPGTALRQFAAVRSVRHTALGADLAGYELSNEFTEGLAKYIEYRFYQEGTSLTPHPEMYLMNGFDGYQRLGQRFDEQLQFAEHIIRGDIAVNNDPFGAGNLRFRLYPMGALEGLLLDRVMPDWTDRIFEPGVYPSTLLVEAAKLSPSEAESALVTAKRNFDYDTLFADKQSYERDGRAAAQAKVDALIHTDLTLVRIAYDEVSNEPPRLGFTPFGVTPLGEGRALYELVPLSARFDDTASLSMRTAIPVLVDTRRREILFAVPVSVGAISAVDGAVETEAFVLTGRVANIVKSDNEVRIELR